MTGNRIVIVVTAHGTLGSSGQPTGFYLEEVAAPYVAFTDASYDVDIASIPGGPAPRSATGRQAWSGRAGPTASPSCAGVEPPASSMPRSGRSS